MNNFSKSDFKGLENYSEIEGSKKMKEILNWLWKKY